MTRVSYNPSKHLAKGPRIWQPSSWRDFPATQQPHWPETLLSETTQKIHSLPPLTSAQEIDALKHLIAAAGRGQAFLLQGGDCAERFQDCNESHILGRLRILVQMGVVIGFASRRPVVRIGRMAGQYAKPRSEPHETTADGMRLPSFRGENINSIKANLKDRSADPERLLMAYHHSGATLNFMRTILSSRSLDIQDREPWEQKSAPLPRNLIGARYERIARAIAEAQAFVRSQSFTSEKSPYFPVDFFVSHEALILPYEEAMTRYVSSQGSWYNASSHMLWIGERTRHGDGAHVEYCRGIANPIGVKIGPDANPDDVVNLVTRLNPHNEAGKIVLITRLGADQVSNRLPALACAFKNSSLNVTWSVDPMHGNTERSPNGFKTRRLENIMKEIQSSAAVHKSLGTHLGGVHLELTHEAVTECVGGSDYVSEDDLSKRYETWCDPRLNDSQSLEVAFLLADLLDSGDK